jgi:hypothetical protein
MYGLLNVLQFVYKMSVDIKFFSLEQNRLENVKVYSIIDFYNGSGM